MASSRRRPARVDNTAPEAIAVDLEGGDAWRNRNDFDLSWTTLRGRPRANLGRLHQDLLVDRNRMLHEGPSGREHLKPAKHGRTGTWGMASTLWRLDAAGNQGPANASVPITLRFDPQPPELAFETSPSSDPTLISVAVTDKISGLAGGQIELSKQGSGTWQALSTLPSKGVALSPGSTTLACLPAFTRSAPPRAIKPLTRTAPTDGPTGS